VILFVPDTITVGTSKGAANLELPRRNFLFSQSHGANVIDHFPDAQRQAGEKTKRGPK